MVRTAIASAALWGLASVWSWQDGRPSLVTGLFVVNVVLQLAIIVQATRRRRRRW